MTWRTSALCAGLLVAAGALGGALAVVHHLKPRAPASAPAPAPAPTKDATMVRVGGTSNACACSQRIEP